MKTVNDYVELVEKTLQYWLDTHTDPEKWAQAWIVDDDIEYTFKESPVISNNYFTFEWKKSALKRLAEEQQHLFNVCKNCGCLNENGFGGCCDEEEEGEEPTVEDLTYWLEDIEAQPTPNALMESLIKDGYEVYREALQNIIAPVVEEVSEALKAIREAETREDELQAVLWGTRVFHVHGNIMQDYAEQADYEADYKLIDSIRNNGLESVYSREEINDYLQEA